MKSKLTLGNTTKASNSLPPKQVRYKTSLVTYMDILGFRELLQERSAGEISRILRVVKTAANHDRQSEKDFERLYESFSDLTLRTVVVWSKENLLLRPTMLLYELQSIARIQIELLRDHDILLRGGIALGPLVKSWGLVYGTGMVNAYELEQIARQPRVILHDTLVHIIEQGADEGRWNFEFNEVTSRDGSTMFVDYLAFSRYHFEELDDLMDFLAVHKRIIEKGLSRFAEKPRVRAKFKWLKRYHNSTIRHLGAHEMDKSLLVA